MDVSVLLERISQSAAENVLAPGDYVGEDGLIYCGICKEPKQAIITPPVMNTTIRVYIPCKCKRDQYAEDEERRKANEERARAMRLRDMGFPDSEMSTFTFAQDDGHNDRVSRAARNFVEHFEDFRKDRQGLLLYGPPGTGKSFIAACITNALIDKGYTCLMTNFARIVNTITAIPDKQTYIDGLNDFTLLVIDDLAAERETEYVQETVNNIIDARYRTGKPLIITTNLTKKELQDPEDMRKKRIYSRLYDMCIPIEVTGNDRRKDNLRTRFKTAKEILEL